MTGQEKGDLLIQVNS